MIIIKKGGAERDRGKNKKLLILSGKKMYEIGFIFL
jgi:hypothetical protein